MDPTISISFWQTGKKYVDPEHFLRCGSEFRPNEKYLPRKSNFHLNKGNFIDTWQLPKEKNYFLTSPSNSNLDNELHLVDLNATCPVDFQLIPNNQWLWHGMMNNKFSKKCCSDCWPGNVSLLRWLSTRIKLQNVRGVTFVLSNGQRWHMKWLRVKRVNIRPRQKWLAWRLGVLYYLSGCFCLWASLLSHRCSSYVLILLLANSFTLRLLLDSKPLMIASQDPISLIPTFRMNYLQLKPSPSSIPESTRPSSKHQKPYPKSGTAEGLGMGSVFFLI